MTNDITQKSAPTQKADRLGTAARLLFGAAAVSALSLIILLAAQGLSPRPQIQRAASVVGALRLSCLSLSPTGRPLRAPEFAHAGVDLRFSPLLGFSEPGPELLVIAAPDSPETKEGRP